jgi:hypothetical protein
VIAPLPGTFYRATHVHADRADERKPKRFLLLLAMRGSGSSLGVPNGAIRRKGHPIFDRGQGAKRFLLLSRLGGGIPNRRRFFVVRVSA